MKKLMFLACMLWAGVASAQLFSPNQILTASQLNNAFAAVPTLTGNFTFTGSVNATTQGYLDNSTLIATDQFVKRSILAATGTLPIANVTGGTYNFEPTGTGVQIVVFASGGVITSALTIANPGNGYQVGDCLLMVGGNGDAIMRVTSVSGSGVSAVSVVYGGTGYTTGLQLVGMPLPPGSRFGNITGTLMSNATIIIPAGTLLQGSRRVIFTNNTTGGFTVTVKLSNNADGTIGNGVVLAQGSNNSTAMELFTDGVNDVWTAVNAFPTGATCSGSPSASFATINGVVTHC